MTAEFSFSVELPADTDGFIRRQCPSCAKQFKVRSDDTPDDQEQRFCPLCGERADNDSFTTAEQDRYIEDVVTPLAYQMIQDALASEFKHSKAIKITTGDVRANSPVPDPLFEPDDMTIVEPPCHPQDLLKVEDNAANPLYCERCGSKFAI